MLGQSGRNEQAIAAELQAIVQYMWHHVMVKGLQSESLSGVFEKVAMDEMKHAEVLIERMLLRCSGRCASLVRRWQA